MELTSFKAKDLLGLPRTTDRSSERLWEVLQEMCKGLLDDNLEQSYTFNYI